MSFLKPRTSFSSNFVSLSTVMRDNSSVLFYLKLYILSTKGTHQVQIFSELLALELTKFLVIFQTTTKRAHWTKRAHQSTNFQILSALMKIHLIPHGSFETTRSRFIQILHHCSVPCLLCIFYLKPLYFGQKEPIEVKFSDF